MRKNDSKLKRKEVEFSQHVREQLIDRGTSEDEIKIAIKDGEEAPAKKGRKAYRKIFLLNLTGKGSIIQLSR